MLLSAQWVVHLIDVDVANSKLYIEIMLSVPNNFIFKGITGVFFSVVFLFTGMFFQNTTKQFKKGVTIFKMTKKRLRY